MTLKNTPSMRDELVSKGRKRLTSFFRSWDEIAVHVVRKLEIVTLSVSKIQKD
jgi:hypothetical protein